MFTSTARRVDRVWGSTTSGRTERRLPLGDLVLCECAKIGRCSVSSPGKGPFTARSTLHEIKRSVPAVLSRSVSDTLTHADHPRSNYFKRPQFMCFLPVHTAGKQGRSILMSDAHSVYCEITGSIPLHQNPLSPRHQEHKYTRSLIIQFQAVIP